MILTISLGEVYSADVSFASLIFSHAFLCHTRREEWKQPYLWGSGLESILVLLECWDVEEILPSNSYDGL